MKTFELGYFGNMDGEAIEDICGEQHDPESASARNAGYWEKVNKIDV